MANDFIKKRQEEGEIDNNIELISLMHYSSTAQLTLSPKDKADIIWKWQVGSPSEREQILAKPLRELSFFQEKQIGQ